MKREFVAPEPFLFVWKKLKLTEEDLRELENFLIKTPDAGDMIIGTNVEQYPMISPSISEPPSIAV